MSTRKEYIQQLINGFVVENNELKMGNVGAHFLHNPYTANHCQIIEARCSGLASSMAYHLHPDSKEIFYQIAGLTYFSDGQILKEGEIKIILPNILHSVSFSKDGLCIVIVHPLEEAYPIGGDK